MERRALLEAVSLSLSLFLLFPPRWNRVWMTGEFFFARSRRSMESTLLIRSELQHCATLAHHVWLRNVVNRQPRRSTRGEENLQILSRINCETRRRNFNNMRLWNRNSDDLSKWRDDTLSAIGSWIFLSRHLDEINWFDISHGKSKITRYRSYVGGSFFSAGGTVPQKILHCESDNSSFSIPEKKNHFNWFLKNIYVRVILHFHESR